MLNMNNKKTMENDNLWAVRGISQETRNAAKMAAKKSKVSLGAWLSRKIMEAAQADLTEKNTALVRQEDVLDILENLSNKFEKDVLELRNQLESVKSQKKSWIQVVFNKGSKI